MLLTLPLRGPSPPQVLLSSLVKPGASLSQLLDVARAASERHSQGELELELEAACVSTVVIHLKKASPPAPRYTPIRSFFFSSPSPSSYVSLLQPRPLQCRGAGDRPSEDGLATGAALAALVWATGEKTPMP